MKIILDSRATESSQKFGKGESDIESSCIYI